MTKPDNFQIIFSRLKAILEPYAPKLVVVADTDDNFYLDTSFVQKNKKPLFFGAVRKGKAYVSFYLMPVYVYPELLAGISPELKRRMQGKSCFNFASGDDKLFKELAKLTKAGFVKYKQAKYV
jgi:hypothetical protein